MTNRTVDGAVDANHDPWDAANLIRAHVGALVETRR